MECKISNYQESLKNPLKITSLKFDLRFADQEDLKEAKVDFNSLDVFENVKKIALVQLKLRKFPSCIGNLKKLTEIDLTYSKFDLTEALQTLATVKSLKKIKLAEVNRGIKNIPSEIKYLRHVDSIDFSFNELTELPQEMSALKCSQLIFDRNNFKNFPLALTQMSGLKKLDISGCKIKDIPKEISSLKELTRLGLGGNKIKSLPAELFDLGNLEELNLERNNIQRLPEDIKKLTKLTDISLFINKISTIPGGLFKLYELERLSLGHNKIGTIPDIGNLSKLVSLNVDGCQLKSIPTEIQKLKNLKILSAEKNPFEQSEAEIRSYLPEKIRFTFSVPDNQE
ncbi:MAG: leucine-rich repeat domain-containing protein [Desulfobacteraceae bacterium]|nr:leucine-rich repeat domain-containing protein [Desulfobacteraceae bacterium]